MKAKLTDVQRLRLGQAHDNAQAVLREIKAKPLKGAALEQMKMIEDAAASLGAVLILASK